MENKIIVNTGNNSYFYSCVKKHLFTLSPVMEQILRLGDNAIENMEELDAIPTLQKMSSVKVPVELYKYYLGKYQLLKAYNYFEKPNPQQYLSARISPEILERNLANTRQVVFEVTQDCNLACKYCAFGENYSNYEMRNHKHMEFEIITKFIDYLLQMKEKHNRSFRSYLNIGFYGGEPLLNFALVEKTVNYLSQLGVDDRLLGYSMTTNGLLIKKHIDFLVQHDFLLHVSLDGDREGNELRVQKNGEPSFNIVFENVKFIQNRYPEFFKKNVSFATVINQKNSLEQIYDFFMKEFRKVSNISEINKLGFNTDNLEKYREMWKGLSHQICDVANRKDLLHDMYEKLPIGGQLLSFFNHFLFNFYKDFNSLLNPEMGSRSPSGTCNPFSRKIYITAYGSILQCERIGHFNILGQVTDSEVAIDFNWIANKVNAFSDEISKLCEQCYEHRNCLQCGFYIEKENGLFTCPRFKNKEDFCREITKTITDLERDPNAYKKILKEIDLVW